MSKACLEVSKCGRFAALVNSTGFLFLVWSKEHTHFMITSGIELALFTSDDAEMLRQAVDNSVLPPTDEGVSPELIGAITLCNQELDQALTMGMPVLYDEVIIRGAIRAVEMRSSARNN